MGAKKNARSKKSFEDRIEELQRVARSLNTTTAVLHALQEAQSAKTAELEQLNEDIQQHVDRSQRLREELGEIIFPDDEVALDIGDVAARLVDRIDELSSHRGVVGFGKPKER